MFGNRWWRSPKEQKRKITENNPAQAFILLDKFSVTDIQKWKKYQDAISKFHWDFYSDLAYKRAKISDKIKESLLGATEKSFAFSKWQRSIKYKYSLDPLSVKGSLVDPGGRFNVGDISPQQFPPFPAFYVGLDKETVMQESLSQEINIGDERRALDFALSSPTSISIVSVSGSLDSVIDLKRPEKLTPFLNLIKDFSIPDSIKADAKKVGLTEPILISSETQLINALLFPSWRLWPMQFDVPAASQIFGQLVADAGIEGILYESKFSSSNCLVIFPQNFDDTSFLTLDDPVPLGVKITRLDAKVWATIQ